MERKAKRPACTFHYLEDNSLDHRTYFNQLKAERFPTVELNTWENLNKQ